MTNIDIDINVYIQVYFNIYFLILLGFSCPTFQTGNNNVKPYMQFMLT